MSSYDKTKSAVGSMQNLTKAEAARRQLGTALSMYLANQDPVSVHALAFNGWELAQGLAEIAGARPIMQHALEVNNVSIDEYRNSRSKIANAIKHFYKPRSKIIRENNDALASLTEADNEAILWCGWMDFIMSGNPAPMEALVYGEWFMARTPERFMQEPLAQSLKVKLMERFPKIEELSPRDQKRLLTKSILKAKRSIGWYHRYDARPLILGPLA